jgi:hypothetical protein
VRWMEAMPNAGAGDRDDNAIESRWATCFGRMRNISGEAAVRKRLPVAKKCGWYEKVNFAVEIRESAPTSA